MNFEPSGYFHTCTCMYTYILPGLAGRERPLYAIVCILTLSAYVVQILCYCARIHFPLAAFRPPTRIHIHAHVHVRVNYVHTCVCVYPLSLRMACIIMYAVFLVSSVTCTCMVYSTCAYMCMVYCWCPGEPLLVQGVTVHTCRWIRFLNLITVYVCSCVCLFLDWV